MRARNLWSVYESHGRREGLFGGVRRLRLGAKVNPLASTTHTRRIEILICAWAVTFLQHLKLLLQPHYHRQRRP